MLAVPRRIQTTAPQLKGLCRSALISGKPVNDITLSGGSRTAAPAAASRPR
jgi:hypothetical protein